jgi:DNA-binding NtrC family response regulator/tetratricopeptide (TPR) repeat protein
MERLRGAPPLNAIDLGPRYELLEELGSGEQGLVLLVRDRCLGKKLALKLLRDGGGSRRDPGQLQREFALLSRIAHPGIARAYDFGYLEGRPYFTRSFVPGKTLAEAPRLSPRPLLGVFREVARALAFLHRSEVLHLDVKPENIVLAAGRGPLRPVLIDFGLWRRGLEQPPDAAVHGSLPFMGPEYFRGGPLGPATDVYALGATLYWLIARRFPRPRPASTGCRGPEPEWDAPPLPLADHLRGLPPDLEWIILRSLSVDPSARFPSAGEVLEALERLGEKEGLTRERAAPAIETVGRKDELRRVDCFLDGVFRSDGPRCLLLTGPAGMGQSHLFRDMKVRAQVRGLGFFLETGFPGRSPPPGSLFAAMAGSLPGMRAGSRARWLSFLTRLRLKGNGGLSDAFDADLRLRRAREVSAALRSLREPLVLAVDGLQHFDEVSIELASSLIRYLIERPAERPPLAVALGYREEGPSQKTLEELSALLHRSGAPALSVGPLAPWETIELHRRLTAGSARPPAPNGRPEPFLVSLGIFQRTGGSPARVAAVAAGEAAQPGGRTAFRLPPGRRGRQLRRPERRLVQLLAVLERPSAAPELARLAGLPLAAAGRLLKELERRELIVPAVSGRPGGGLVPGPSAAGTVESIGASRRRLLHRRIARNLLEGATRRKEKLVEALLHFQKAGEARALIHHAPAAARFLRFSCRARAALDLLQAAKEAHLRLGRRPPLELTLDLADLQARTGAVKEGIRQLREVLSRREKVPPLSRLKAMFWLATLHARDGEFLRADALFSRGLSAGDSSGLRREEHLFFLNEHAAVKAFLGESGEASRLCEVGLRLCRKGKSARDREVSLNLLATRANVALRMRDYRRAGDDYRKSLEIADSLGSLSNRAVILNNLAAVHSQCGRAREAARALREAEEACHRLDERAPLASIHGNLAVLAARTGNFEEMERALEEAVKAASAGPRQEFVVEHSRGLCLLYRGRYREARERLEAAIRLAEGLGDRHVSRMDQVYRAEALLFLAEYPEARSALERLSGPGEASWVRSASLSRLSLLHALIGEVDPALKAVERHGEVGGEAAGDQLADWDVLYLSWALSIAGRPGEALARLSRAEARFRQAGLAPAAALASWIRAEAHLLSGQRSEALRVLSESGRGRSDLLAGLEPLLEARLRLEDASTPEEREKCADLLTQAASAFAGNPLPEWQHRLEVLRGRLDGGGDTGHREGQRAIEAMVLALPPEGRERYRGNLHLRAWIEVPATAGRRRRPGGSDLRDDSTETRTLELRPAAASRGELVARSPSMRRLSLLLDRLRDSDLPVLIQGETGSGKELAAWLLHAGSRRSEGPFRVVDCAAIPVPLLESELFGARAGAFSGQDRDRPGLLALARGGTVLFDEVSALIPELQAKLLRTLSERTMRPLGAEVEEPVDVRFIFSTSRDLDLDVREGRFRRDLLHRIQAVVVRVPPLRERQEDLPELVEVFLDDPAGGALPRGTSLGKGVLSRLRAHSWPGNVRELKHLLARLRLENPRAITLEALERALGGEAPRDLLPRNVLLGESLTDIRDRIEREYLVCHFRRLGGDTAALCRFLAISRRQLYRRCVRLRIRLRRERIGLRPE